MKNIFSKFLVLLSAATLLAGCDEIALDSGAGDMESFEPNGTVSDAGYLNLSSVGLTVNSSSEDYDGKSTKAAGDAVVGSGENTSDYYITITNNTNPDFIYGPVKYSLIEDEDGDGQILINLDQGSYTLTASSVVDVPECGEEPTYCGSTTFNIKKEETTNIAETITCYLSNVKVMVTFSADLKDIFAPDDYNGGSNPLTAKVILGGDQSRSAVFTRQEVADGMIVYFSGDDSGEPLEILLSGYYNIASEGETPNYALIENWSQTLSGVKVGEWRNIELNIPGVTDGNVLFGVTVQKWTYSEGLDVDVTTANFLMGAPLVEDLMQVPENTMPFSPVVAGDGVGSVYEVTDDMFDMDVETVTDLMNGTITPQGGAAVTSVVADFTDCSTNMKMLLKSYGIVDDRAQIFPESELTNAVVKQDDAGQVSFSLKYTGMKNLFNQCFGEHRVLVVAADELSRTSYTYVDINVVNAGSPDAPIATWANHDFDQTYALDGQYDDDNIPTEYVINIASPKPITGFTLMITSDVLDAQELSGVSLATIMDLVNPDDDIVDGLINIGVPYGDKVEGQNEVMFDINKFIPMLANLGALYDDDYVHEFTLTVSNDSGMTSKSMKLKTIGKNSLK